MSSENYKSEAKRSRINPRVDSAFKSEVENFCRQRGIRVADFAREALADYLKKQRTESA